MYVTNKDMQRCCWENMHFFRMEKFLFVLVSLKVKNKNKLSSIRYGTIIILLQVLSFFSGCYWGSFSSLEFCSFILLLFFLFRMTESKNLHFLSIQKYSQDSSSEALCTQFFYFLHSLLLEVRFDVQGKFYHPRSSNSVSYVFFYVYPYMLNSEFLLWSLLLFSAMSICWLVCPCQYLVSPAPLVPDYILLNLFQGWFGYKK